VNFLLYIPIILFFCFILVKAVDQVIIGLHHLALKNHINLFATTAILMALATSIPELSVALTAGLQGVPNLSLGNVIGANIANLTFVIGLATLLTGSMAVRGSLLNREIYLGFAAGCAPLFLLLDGSLSRIDAVVLLIVYAAYATSLFRSSYQKIAAQIQHPGEGALWRKIGSDIQTVSGEGKDLIRLLLGLALMILSADIIIRLASRLADSANIPQFIVGLILLALGTTLPELAFSIKVLRDRTISMFYGNILGSIIANSTLIIGIAALLSPIQVKDLSEYAIATGVFVLAFFLLWFFVRSKHRLDRIEAAVLFSLYFIFVLVELVF